MPTIYKIHPGIGIARLGNSPYEFYLAPETPAALPTECEWGDDGFPSGKPGEPVTRFKDDEGRIRRQAARFQVYVYDDESPEGRPLELGDPVSGGGNQGTLIDIEWRVYLANKKASWYQFEQLQGEHGYAPDHPRRSPEVVGADARQHLIIDPGPRVVSINGQREAFFDRAGGDVYATTFPPKLEPNDIDTLGAILAADDGRLLVLGGHGNSGSIHHGEIGQPRIEHYANNDGWFDDTSDGPVTARLVMHSEEVDATRFIDVEAPGWVIVGYPRYAPEMLDMVGADEVLDDLGVRIFAERTDLYGEVGTFDRPQHIPPTDTEGLILWRAGRLGWNPKYRPWFYRDIWPILFRADQFSYLTSILGLSNFPHNQSQRGTFDPFKLGVPPRLDREALRRCQRECLRRYHSGELFVEELTPVLDLLGRRQSTLLRGGEDVAQAEAVPDRVSDFRERLRRALEEFAASVDGAEPDEGSAAYLEAWRRPPQGDPSAQQRLEARFEEALRDLGAQPESTAALVRPAEPVEPWEQLRAAVDERLRAYHSGRLLERCLAECVVKATIDPYRDYRLFLFDMLRRSGEENTFRAGNKPDSRMHGLPLMPLLAGDNPISNTLPSKFFRLTDLQYYLLRQWAEGVFVNEEMEGWAHPDPWNPYEGWVNRTGRDLDRGVLSNVMGGSFCPGAEIGWILRNPSIYSEPYRVKADPDFATFRQTAAMANANKGLVPEADYSAYTGAELSQDDDFARGLQPGDLTKHMAQPWQSDFNECTTQEIDVTYEAWNDIYPESENDLLMARERAAWETLWWPAHRPLQVYETIDGNTVWVDWSRGIPQTNAGGLKMVTHWWTLPFVVRNPGASDQPSEVPPPSPPPFIAIERSHFRIEDEETEE